MGDHSPPTVHRRLAQASIAAAVLNLVATTGVPVMLPSGAATVAVTALVAAGVTVSIALFVFGARTSLGAPTARRSGFVAIGVVAVSVILIALAGLVSPWFFLGWAGGLVAFVAFVGAQLTRWSTAPAPLPKSPLSLFISYRHDDARETVGRLCEHLREHFHEDRIFRDIDRQQAGDDYRAVVRRALEGADVVLVVIGDDWLTVIDDQGCRRLDDPDDLVRVEIETALARQHAVIPVLIEGMTMPAEDALPTSLQPLRFLTALQARPDPDFADDVKKLIAALRSTRSSSA